MKYVFGYGIKLAIFYLDIITALGFTVWVAYLAVPILLSKAPRRQLIISTAVTTILLISGIFISPSGLHIELVVLNRTIMITGLWMLLHHLLRMKIEEQEQRKLYAQLEASTREIKLLRGVLPICSVCKKIRNHEGEWEQLELYIRDRSEAEFSHSYCPECAEKARKGL
ncbi:MAG: hypothetical protein OEW04_00585 [Nitrospirota bacterium]|nr:hypothetical protein [Nitrospirota bacterium]